MGEINVDMVSYFVTLYISQENILIIVKHTQIYGGMRTMKSMICETSVLDPDEGIRFRGYTIPECQEHLTKFQNGQEPMPEALFWLLCTGSMPEKAQTDFVRAEWARRAALPSYIVHMLNSFPATLHPMAQFSAAITALNAESEFAQAYAKGVRKQEYWSVSVVFLIEKENLFRINLKYFI